MRSPLLFAEPQSSSVGRDHDSTGSGSERVLTPATARQQSVPPAQMGRLRGGSVRPAQGPARGIVLTDNLSRVIKSAPSERFHDRGRLPGASLSPSGRPLLPACPTGTCRGEIDV